MSKMELYNYKRAALVVARDLFYGEKVIEAIKKCTSAEQISKTLTNARLAN